MQIKSVLRKELLAARKLVPEEKRMELSFKTAEALFSTDEFKRADSVFCYINKKEEIYTRGIVSYAILCGKKVAAPMCRGCEMIFKYINDENDLEKGVFSVYEPKSYCTSAEVSPDTVCITPALCYNRQGYRIGYGKGYYDRFFEKNACVKIGLCFEENIIDFNPSEGDKAVDIIVTDKGVYRIKKPDTIRINENSE